MEKDVTIWRIRVAAGLAMVNALMRMHTPTRPSTRTHARNYRPINNSYCSSTATMIRACASVFRYT